MNTPRRLTFPCPPWYSTLENGKARCVPWDLPHVVEARAAGCWFIKDSHDFTDSQARQAATMPFYDLQQLLSKE